MSITVNPTVKFFLSGKKEPVKPNSELWNSQLPANRKITKLKSCKDNPHLITYGDYFEAACTFIQKNNYETILNALSHLKQDIYLKHISKIRISAEKHGQFYHPAKVVVFTDKFKSSFVLNVAISQAGIECAKKEFLTLQKLHKIIPNAFIPYVYHYGEIISTRNKFPVSMFLADWFDGYNEFHISKDPEDGKNKIILWDNISGNLFLSEDIVKEIYRQAAMIMTFFYNIYTFEQIFPWHHAAGDFVVKIKDNKPEVKLITARQYASLYTTDNMAGSLDADSDVVFEALLVFIAVLSIRMRLDRLDGTGDIVWADNKAVEGTVKGFIDGIYMKSKSGIIPCDFNNKLTAYLLAYSEDNLLEILRIVVNSFNRSAPDIMIINSNLLQHSSELYRAIRKLGYRHSFFIDKKK